MLLIVVDIAQSSRRFHGVANKGGISVLPFSVLEIGAEARLWHFATAQHLLRDMVAPPMKTAVAVFTLFSGISLAWQAPTSPRSSTNSLVSRASSCCRTRSRSAAPFMRRRCATTQQNMAIKAATTSGFGMSMRGDAEGHRAFVEKLLTLTGDPLEEDGGRVVVFRGDPSASLMLIGEAPGAEEDRLGVPFVGRSGQLLDDMLRAVGFDPEREVYVSNIVRRRPIDNRTPTPEEMDFYLPFLLEEIGLVDPHVIVLLGASSTKALLPYETRGITRARGQWADPVALAEIHGGRLADMLIMPWFHPSYLLRNSGERSRQEGGVRWHARNDLREVRDVVRGIQQE
ncbi:conserved unknown protein [Ectocarpus siliculosus]|uniref:Type-4 uracil-DNA glycosylase n=1 Tax=Ectocarpus siliculosus TaxID=2880 RepID=D7FN93_ECTSI|nr:conserved unknown protein [Ectocarpus siliculosus]|eukprot:CBJ30150.1 conserved unknown protein [Ectocarpus siliculosus]